MNIKQKVYYIIGRKSKKWLFGRLQINHMTFEIKLQAMNWKESEEMMIDKLFLEVG